MKTLLLVLLTATSLFASDLFLTDADEAFKLAKKSKKPLMIDFFGIWCPPCNQLDETVFSTPTFQAKAKQFVLLKLDVDHPKSFEAKSKYHIAGYPTVLFTNPDGKEINRFVGSRSLKETLRLMDLVLKAKGQSFESACKGTKEDDLWRCAEVCRQNKDSACATKAMAKLTKLLKPGSPRYIEAESATVDQIENTEQKRDAIERLLRAYPKSPLAYGWALEYFSLFEGGTLGKPKREILELPLANFEAMKTDPNLDELGMPLSDLMQMRAQLLANLEKKDEAKTAWKEAAEYLNKLATELPKDSPARGFTIERIYALQEAGEKEEALKLAKEYSAKFPKEFTFHYITASLLKEEKKHAEAIPSAKAAFEHGYGDNKLRAATLLVTLYGTVPDKAAAKEVYDTAMREAKADTKLDVRTPRYIKKLQEAMEKVSAS